ncbi:MAG: carbamoyltransferase HypF [Pyrinomonadaceae bacterium]|nr:carbamoyltransferase HypF [Pyrinomonadaceae bacterium]
MFATSVKSAIKRFRLEISGVVQGVGFRPFIYSVAKMFDLKGFVGNESKGVFIEIEGEEKTLKEFVEYLKTNAPPLSHISEIKQKNLELKNENDFQIIESESEETEFTLISPDISICKDCLEELLDKNNRRYLYPFINCTNCGPRFTITKTVPYDRPNTTMSTFTMCKACRGEYENPLDRRFHAQPISCWDCGVQAWFVGENVEKGKPIEQTQTALKLGKTVAIKGIGGFHLACDARNETAIETLRQRKGRVDKPFAVMCKDLDTAKKFVEINQAESEILTSKERPIVLLKKKNDCGLSELIAPNNQFLGVMLPYSPLHYLLFSNDLDVLVMTSGNFSNEPIVKDNDEALEKLSKLADSFLLHDREIFVQCDDSVVRILATENTEVTEGNYPQINTDKHRSIDEFEKSISESSVSSVANLLPFRRSRGYSPFPVKLPFAVPQILAVGGELKSTFCLTKENFAFMSQHIGDMENLETLQAFENSAEQMKRLFKVEPEIVVGDLHPNYLSSNWAKKTYSNFVAVQHHHAHIASVMAENGVKDEKVIGFAFDGTGYGLDGKIWGGEVFGGDYIKFERLTHLKYFPLAGGDASVKNVYRMALSVLREAEIEWTEDLACVSFCSETEQKILSKQLENNLNVVQTSSFGRLFDAIASIANIRHKATYEAQAAIEFEAILDENVSETYHFEILENEIDYRNLVREAVRDVRANVQKSTISAKFHNAVADLILQLSLQYRKSLSLNKIALSGGCFQNVALLEKSVKLLQKSDFEVLIHKLVPPNDGGLALGQAVIAFWQSK